MDGRADGRVPCAPDGWCVWGACVSVGKSDGDMAAGLSECVSSSLTHCTARPHTPPAPCDIMHRPHVTPAPTPCSPQAKRITVTKDDTIVLHGAGAKSDIASRCEMIRAAMDATTSDYDRWGQGWRAGAAGRRRAMAEGLGREWKLKTGLRGRAGRVEYYLRSRGGVGAYHGSGTCPHNLNPTRTRTPPTWPVRSCRSGWPSCLAAWR